MTKLIDDLFALQQLLTPGTQASPEQLEKINALRAEIPAPITAHLVRQIAGGRRGVVWVRNGVCGGCHLRLSHALVHMLGRTNDLMVCESCGAFVALAPESVPAATPALPPKKRRVVRKLQPAARETAAIAG